MPSVLGLFSSLPDIMNFLLKMFLVAYFASITSEAKVNVSIYYEALCPDSIRFFLEQLAPTYDTLKKHINLNLVPFGKAAQWRINGKWQFSCQHGSMECRGNIYQACTWAKYSVENKDKGVRLIGCIMRLRNPASPLGIGHCFKLLNATRDSTMSCAESTEGEELLAKNGKETLDFEPNFSFIPSIVFEGKFDQRMQDIALNDFVDAVCQQIGDEKPGMCRRRSF